MKLYFKDKKIRALCEQEKEAVKKLGRSSAEKLKRRLADMEAAATVTELVAGNPHPLTGNRHGQFALDLSGGWRLVFAPAHDPIPLKDDTSIDWSQVTLVQIEYIGDYHD